MKIDNISYIAEKIEQLKQESVPDISELQAQSWKEQEKLTDLKKQADQYQQNMVDYQNRDLNILYKRTPEKQEKVKKIMSMSEEQLIDLFA